MWKVALTGNQLKIMALVSMTMDHVGKQFWPSCAWLQVIGRLAFPIFAYMVAEGCAHTKNRKKYFALMAGLAVVCQVVYFVAMGSLYQSVLVTFSLAILLIYITDWAKAYAIGKNRDTKGNELSIGRIARAAVVVAVSFGVVWFVSAELPAVLWRTDYNIDYGFAGILLVVGIYYAKGRPGKLAAAAVMLFALGMTFEGIQWYGLLALLLLALYSGRKGKWRLKYLFYIYYPAHLGCIYLISLLVNQ